MIIKAFNLERTYFGNIHFRNIEADDMQLLLQNIHSTHTYVLLSMSEMYLYYITKLRTYLVTARNIFFYPISVFSCLLDEKSIAC